MLTEKDLRVLIQSVISESRERRYYTFEGSEVEFGSSAHVDDYDKIITELKSVRHQLAQRDRKERDRITRCLESLRFLRKKALKVGVNKGLIEESDF